MSGRGLTLTMPGRMGQGQARAHPGTGRCTRPLEENEAEIPGEARGRDDEDGTERVTGGGFPELCYEPGEADSGQLAIQNGGGHPVITPPERLGVEDG